MANFAKKITLFVETELNLASRAYQNADFAVQFEHLERAHVLGQTSTYHHVRVHILMFVWGVKQLNLKEALAQILRVLGAVTKTAFGFIPSGNTGGSNVNPFKSLPIPPDLLAKIELAKA